MKRNPKKGCNNQPRGYTPARVLAKLPACYGCCRKLVLYGAGCDCADVMKGAL